MSQSQSPDRRPQPPLKDDDILPKGQCNHKLLHPEVQNQRCGCVRFTLVPARPGSSCVCGHMAAYHSATPVEEAVVPKEELDALRTRLETLERLLGREVEAKNTLVVRVSGLEEYNDDTKAQLESEMKTAYRGMQGLWQQFGVLDRRTKVHEERIETLMDVSHGTQQDVRHLQARLVEVDDASMAMEERLDAVAPTLKPRSTSSPQSSMFRQPLSRRPHSSQRDHAHREWTVHISLMPTHSQPFPFEKDTNAYKRVLSRGLHRIVSIPGSDAQSFVTATSREFSSLLKGRPWMPLVAKICDAEHLSGLPMLKYLPEPLLNTSYYDFEFLRKNCATLDNNGNLLDLYIAMRDDSFAWSELRGSPIYLTGLEGSWEFDPYLDRPDAGGCGEVDEEREQSAGDLMRAWSPPATRTKRNATNMTAMGVLGETESKRGKYGHAVAVTPLGRVDIRTEAV